MMIKKTKDNVVAVTERLIAHYKIPVTPQTVEEVLKSHPNYPSLKSITDGLNEWNISNYPMKLQKEELLKIQEPFIAHLIDDKGGLVFVPELNENKNLKYFDSQGRSKATTTNAFFDRYSGVALLIEPDDKSGESEYLKNKQSAVLDQLLPGVAVVALMLLSAFMLLNNRFIPKITEAYFLFFITKIAGLFISVLLVLKDLTFFSTLADKLCGVSKRVDCNSILESPAARVYAWLKWSDIGLIYFTAGLLVMMGIPSLSDYSLMACFSFAALPYVFYSIYYQAFVAKMWCTLCMAVQLVLIVEAALSYLTLYPFSISWISLVKFLLVGSILLFGATLYKAYLKAKQSLKQQRLSYLRLKRNPALFIKLLYQGEKKAFPLSGEVFTIGQQDAPVQITAFLSLNCFPCKETYNELVPLFENIEVNVNLVFLLQEDDRPLVNYVSQLFKDGKQKEASRLIQTWMNADQRKRKALRMEFNLDACDSDCFEIVMSEHRNVFSAGKIKDTPTIFVNGYRLPKEYQVKDVHSFLEFLKTNERESRNM